MIRRLRLLGLLFATLALFLAACGSSDSATTSDTAAKTTTTASATGDTSTTATSTAEVKGEITVSAAASLTEAFGTIKTTFEAVNPGTTITFTFDSSSKLEGQIESGAPADVFASADTTNMDKLKAAGDVEGDPTTFARNQLAIVTKPGNPKGIKTLADLADAGVISLCGADVPCGKFAAQALDGAGVKIDEGNVTRGENAKATLAAVTDGDAVAGIVYVTDAQAAGDEVTTIDIPEAQNVIATYPAAVVKGSENADLAAAFVTYLAGADAQMALKEAGFLAPA